MKHKTEKQTKKQQKPVVIVCILILVLAAVGVGTYFIKKYIPTKERMDLTEYYGQTGEDEMTVILGTDIMETKAVKSGDRVYLPLDMVNTYLNHEILLGQCESADSLCYTFRTSVLSGFREWRQ